MVYIFLYFNKDILNPPPLPKKINKNNNKNSNNNIGSNDNESNGW